MENLQPENGKFCSIWKDAKAIIKQRNDLEVDFRFSILHDVNDVVNTIFSFYQQHCGKDRVKPFIDAAAKLSAKNFGNTYSLKI